MPGISKLIQNNNETIGNVYATQVYIKVIEFQGILISLGENLFHQLVSRFYKKVHILATKYHGYFNIENPNTVSVIFGIKKDELNLNPFHTQKTVLFCNELSKEIEALNKWLGIKVHNQYNNIRNHYLRMPYSERAKINFNDIHLDIATGISTSDLSSGYENHRMRMMNIGNETCCKYASYGGVPYLARKMCEIGEKMSISVCENFYRSNERIYMFKESDKKHINYYGNINSFELVREKSIKDVFFINSFFQSGITDEEIAKISSYLKNLIVGNVSYEEISNVTPSINVSINEFEVFQGYWHKALVNAVMTFVLAGILEINNEKRFALAIIAAWHSYLNIKKEFFTLDSENTLTEQFPSIFLDCNVESIIQDASSDSPTSLNGNIIKHAYFFSSEFFSHEFESAGDIIMKTELIRKLMAEKTAFYQADIFNSLVKIVME